MTTTTLPAAGGLPAAVPADARAAVTALYGAHYRDLVALATFLLRDPGRAEEVVQDAFVALYAGWRRLRDPERAEAYLRQSVVNRSRSSWRRLGRESRGNARHTGYRVDEPAGNAEDDAVAALLADEVLAALRTLPARQREVLTLRYYAGLSEAEIAATLGISAGAVKTHASRGAAALRRQLDGRQLDGRQLDGRR